MPHDMPDETAASSTPPTVAGPIPASARFVRLPMAVQSAGIHVCALVATCFITPIAMGSNLWPIAGVFWSAIAAPVGGVIGAVIGLLVRRMPRGAAMGVIAVSTIAMCGIAIWHIRQS